MVRLDPALFWHLVDHSQNPTRNCPLCQEEIAYPNAHPRWEDPGGTGVWMLCLACHPEAKEPRSQP